MNEEKYVEMLENGELYDYITNLQQAVKNTKETADDMLYELNERIENLYQELQRKDNNWNELKKYIEEHNECWELEPILDKIKELEESNENRKCS